MRVDSGSLVAGRMHIRKELGAQSARTFRNQGQALHFGLSNRKWLGLAGIASALLGGGAVTAHYAGYLKFLSPEKSIQDVAKGSSMVLTIPGEEANRIYFTNKSGELYQVDWSVTDKGFRSRFLAKPFNLDGDSVEIHRFNHGEEARTGGPGSGSYAEIKAKPVFTFLGGGYTDGSAVSMFKAGCAGKDDTNLLGQPIEVARVETLPGASPLSGTQDFRIKGENLEINVDIKDQSLMGRDSIPQTRALLGGLAVAIKDSRCPKT